MCAPLCPLPATTLTARHVTTPCEHLAFDRNSHGSLPCIVPRQRRPQPATAPILVTASSIHHNKTPPRRDDDISDVMQEITALANCACEQITKYHDSLMLPGTSKLLISMELMACSGSDVVRPLSVPLGARVPCSVTTLFFFLLLLLPQASRPLRPPAGLIGCFFTVGCGSSAPPAAR